MRVIDRVIYRLMLRDLTSPWQWPRNVSDAEWNPVSFPGPLERPLAGLFGRAASVSRGVVVCAHPVRPDAKAYFLRSGVADLLREAGFDVLLFDFNGFGQSPRSGFDYAGEVMAAAHEAQRRAPGLPLVFFGACFGAGSGLSILTRPDNPFSAVVAEGAPASWSSYYARPPAVRLTLRQQWIRQRGRMIIQFGRLFHPRLARQLRTLHHLRDAQRLDGVLFLYGAEDPLIPASVGEELYATCRDAWRHRPSPPVCDLWIAPSTRHLTYYQADPEGYRAALLSFLDATLGPLPSRALHTHAACAPAETQGA